MCVILYEMHRLPNVQLTQTLTNLTKQIWFCSKEISTEKEKTGLL